MVWWGCGASLWSQLGPEPPDTDSGGNWPLESLALGSLWSGQPITEEQEPSWKLALMQLCCSLSPMTMNGKCFFTTKHNPWNGNGGGDGVSWAQNKESQDQMGKQKTTFIFFLETILLETGEPVRVYRYEEYLDDRSFAPHVLQSITSVAAAR